MLLKITPKIISAVKEIEALLVSKNYNNLSSGGRTNRLSNEEVEVAINNYGGSVTERPDDSLSDLQVIEIEGNDFKTYHVDYDLYVNGKQSDLTLSLIVTNQGNNYIASIEDLHVL
jgi:hypothetical protein